MKHHAIIRTKEDWVVDTIIYFILSLVLVTTLYPFLNVLALSLNDGLDSMRGGITIWPREFTTHSYKMILSDTTIYSATLVSVKRTLLSTTLNVIVTVITGYLLSRKEFVLRRFMNLLLVFTMYISAGLVPSYLLIKELHLIGSFWVYVVPSLVSVFNIMIVRTYIEGLPESFVESARIDGASEFKIIFRIIVPLIVPVIAVIVLFVVIQNWNSWFDTFIYGNGKKSMMTLQYKLMEILASTNIEVSSNNAAAAAADAAAAAAQHGESITPESVRTAMTIIVALPVIILYPFLQRYFVSGMTLGGVKE
ncbi:carbohydrate ABC transporter permease [Paenibacillus roseipurpureus]|uniref:Carbohydrate ABC transporter permease n=1 Tax=Paenibacillus roseopurpureus TaxID=2918901 RepID=A0AA96RJS5_9BACL|nr:carbohydrate ABC transporter permease [Paenibacillus sp. MBLB1832]WNR43476.1 carbohydrate ABC transporter permease [Paenibacillus sp. MBLB1832]